MADGRYIENRDSVISRTRIVRFEKKLVSRSVDAESHTDDNEMVKIKTESRILIRRHLCLETRSRLP